MGETNAGPGSQQSRSGGFRASLFKTITRLASSGAQRLGFERSNGTILTSGEMRHYLLHVPGNLDPSKPVPLVITFHGFAEWPVHVMRTSRWSDLADRHGFIVVYPSGSGMPKRWRTGITGLKPDDAAADVQFAADLLAELQHRYHIDPKRIYLNGFSNGAGFSHMLALEWADRIAAFGSVSGALLYPTQGRSLARPVPFIAFHGTKDRIVPFHGGPTGHFQFTFPPVTDWVHAWAELDGCDPKPATIFNSPHVTGQQYLGGNPAGEVVFYTIDGGGHAWPGGVPLPRWIAGRTTKEIDATEIMWQFFVRHPLSD